MFQVIDQNGDTETVYSVRSYKEQIALTELVQYGSRELANCVEIRLITEFLIYNQHYNEWVWADSEGFKPVPQGSK